MPKVPPAQMQPRAMRLSYLRLSMAGRARIPMVATAAPTMPVIAAMTVQMITVPMANPPRKGPNHMRITVNRSSMTPER